MKDLQIFNYGSKEIRIIMKDGEPWWVARDVCEVLGIVNNRDALSRLDEDEKNTVIINGGNKGNPNMSIINEFGLKRLLSRSHKPESKKLAKKLGLILVTTKEQDTLETIINSLQDIIEYKTQFQIDKYRIDLYIPSLNLAIECDENNHKDRNIEYEQKREDEIKDLLNCEFIRFNPDDPNFNIGEIINKIFKIILSEETDIANEIFENYFDDEEKEFLN
jgi:very-short-patch-repair endonuclease